ncbi:ethanolamine kinase [Episyrphus balteatus]|uniref:ethanolamine kinase n=1 Tax=Episyrphus balteatus TaxID=286459 RepID=UPI002486AF51|nr:ethanolamine kinase [Episyrphus balteatus]
MGTEGCCQQQTDSETTSKLVLEAGHNSNDRCCKNNGSRETAETEVPFIPLTVDENDVISGAKEILKVIRSHWDLSTAEFKIFTDGITNKLVGCFNKTPQDDNNTSQNGATDYSKNVVLVRVYGNKTDLLIDRKAETRNIKLLHSYGFAPSLFATFKNGLAYEYVPGVTLNPESVTKPEIWKLVACRMADMHKVSQDNGLTIPSSTRESMLWKKVQSFFDLVPERFSDADKHSRLEKTFLPISKIRNEFEMLYKKLKSLNSPLVFAHNDLLLGNVIYTESLSQITLIDYEYADYNFQAFDIGNHFAEFAGVDEVDYKRYPSKEFQLNWLRTYLESYLGTSQVSDEQVETLYVQVNQFALAAHFFWTIWALIQAEYSTIDFDFVDYAFTRYNEYLSKKDQFLSLDTNTNSLS